MSCRETAKVRHQSPHGDGDGRHQSDGKQLAGNDPPAGSIPDERRGGGYVKSKGQRHGITEGRERAKERNV